MTTLQRVAILGSTGSIGVSTLDVIARHPDRFTVTALSAHSNVDRLREQCLLHKPAFVVVSSPTDAARLGAELTSAGLSTRVMVGEHALGEIAAHDQVDVVMAGIVGAA
ncbi:MAG TPA: 1-deoxy-D-xylulose-5-phosphate reductoisomerase, partial [Steroidobacteraceae bacterium]|nr:1-deoxy-D-xylulose-5-phosphate reductoisomerase [Steroidobacteraceae bacterium]